ncbi:MAG: LamG domain-containing protein [Symploca sp. SIO2E6]|nr:LamG domain-containing protein [Symploca sp. SIO2E6]
MIKITRKTLAVAISTLSILLPCSKAVAATFSQAENLVIDDAVFAYDFETVQNDTIQALRGSDATKTSNVVVDAVDPIERISNQHLQAPTGSGFSSINSNTRLSESISEFSFSIFYNDRGDNGRDGSSTSAARLLSSYNGTGVAQEDEVVFDLLSNAGRRLRFVTKGTSVFSSEAIPFRDEIWHQAGFVFDNGSLTFYFDGLPLGDSRIIPGITSISAQSFNWSLLEDARPVSILSEYFDSGDYDEAALWYRALSPQEMNALYTQGVNQASIGNTEDKSVNIPEPTSMFALILMGGILTASALRKENNS